MAVPLPSGSIVVVVVSGQDSFFDPLNNPWGSSLSTRVSDALVASRAQLAILNFTESDSYFPDVLTADAVNYTATVTVKTLVDRSGPDEVKAAVAALFLTATGGITPGSAGVSSVNNTATGEPVPSAPASSWIDNLIGGVGGFLGDLSQHLELVIGLIVLLAIAAIVWLSSSSGTKLLRLVA